VRGNADGANSTFLAGGGASAPVLAGGFGFASWPEAGLMARTPAEMRAAKAIRGKMRSFQSV
jgi:hypothetical protein